MATIGLLFKKHRTLILCLAVSAAAICSLTVWAVLERRGRLDAEIRLDADTQRAYYGFSEALGQAELSTGKLLVSSSAALTGELLLDIGRQCDRAGEFAARIIPDPDTAAKLIGFLNLSSDYTRSLVERCAQGYPLSYADSNNMNDLHTTFVLLAQSGDAANTREGASADAAQSTAEALAQRMSDALSEGVSLPTLIYDGPFSESLQYKQAKGINGAQISLEQAIELARVSFNITEADEAGETGGLIPCYSIRGQGKYALYSRTGGHLIMFLDEEAPATRLLSPEACMSIAVSYASKAIGTQMSCTWSGVYDNTGIYSIAPVEDGAAIYTELIKVKVSLEDGSICGWDARAYYMNATKVSKPQSIISETEARSMLSRHLDAATGTLCVIPTDTEDTLWAYEFRASYSGDDYIVYINAQSGSEEKVFKVVSENESYMTR